MDRSAQTALAEVSVERLNEVVSHDCTASTREGIWAKGDAD